SMRAWPIERADQIDERALELVIARAAEIDTLIIGTGREVFLFPNDLRVRLRELGIVVDAMQTGPAIRVYNIMVGERRRVAAGLIAVS
ncbi:MTH938/NDUFAF3 family protein, partial [Klebsiella aerogenes]|uniref:MTH938/NDUFAF3 family protein n=1 Tax=Klebsiella aerogenes TaxID=548 RepID=UPI00195395C1